MTFRVKFSEQGGSFRARFGEVQNISDGGFERGYAEGYEDGYTRGHAEGVEQGYADGYEQGDSNMDGILTRRATTIRNDRITYLGMEVFRNYDSLAIADFPNVTSTGVNVFYACYALHTVNLPSLISISTNMFGYSSLLKRLDFPSVENIGGGAFSGCSRLVTLILRKADTVCTLANVNAFTNTSIAKGTGYIYVPDNLVEQYKAATNWSTYASQIKPISELEE